MDAEELVTVTHPPSRGWSESFGTSSYVTTTMTVERAASIMSRDDIMSHLVAQALDNGYTPRYQYLELVNFAPFDKAGVEWLEFSTAVHQIGAERLGGIMRDYSAQVHKDTKGEAKIIVAELIGSLSGDINRRYELFGRDMVLTMVSLVSDKRFNKALKRQVIYDAVAYYGARTAVDVFASHSAEQIALAIKNGVDSELLAAV